MQSNCLSCKVQEGEDPPPIHDVNDLYPYLEKQNYEC